MNVDPIAQLLHPLKYKLFHRNTTGMALPVAWKRKFRLALILQNKS